MIINEKITASTVFDTDRRDIANGMQGLLSTNQFMVKAYLFSSGMYLQWLVPLAAFCRV